MSPLSFLKTYPETWSRLSSEIKEEILERELKIESLAEFLKTKTGRHDDRAFLSELARLEYEINRVKNSSIKPPKNLSTYTVNPSLSLIELSWKNLTSLLKGREASTKPIKGQEIVIIYKRVKDDLLVVKKAEDKELLALKLIVEGYDLRDVSSQIEKPLWLLREVVEQAVQQELILKPESKIRRPPEHFEACRDIDEDFLVSETFTLQWHITQNCDLHCRHCYDRSDRKTLRFNDAVRILDDFYDFCERMNVSGKVSLSGGNPFLHPRFFDIYREAIDRGFSVSVLGNPVSRKRLESLLEIQRPYFYQVSLEGLREYNDYIRGEGHFDRTIQFLLLLKELGIYSMVMLTLNRDNLTQVIPLTKELDGIVDCFTFNRLSMVGEGASLRLPDRETFKGFLEQYIELSDRSDMVEIKDNLFNIILQRRGRDLFGGCTGFGCGAAFNFVSLLPDGEVHACRKFPSYIGNIFEESLFDIYHSDRAEIYRRGPSECRGCSIRPVCGGCLAVSYSFGLDFTRRKDPFCFKGD
ncbi:MAG: selenobiotic family peptide radical SAM maturase [Nitrospirae bacterium]|nr:MAG: selenobiotic family peptide radical SAM maturase [Nitrospirota bacterium]